MLGTVQVHKKRCCKCLWGVEVVGKWGERWKWSHSPKLLGSVEETKLSLWLPVLDPKAYSIVFQLLLICSPLAFFLLRLKIPVLWIKHSKFVFLKYLLQALNKQPVGLLGASDDSLESTGPCHPKLAWISYGRESIMDAVDFIFFLLVCLERRSSVDVRCFWGVYLQCVFFCAD